MSDTLPTFVYPNGRNRAMCRLCLNVVESRYRHEWKACECGRMYVDGGHAYFRSGGQDGDVIRLGDYDLPDRANDPYTHLVHWKDGTLSGYTPEEYVALLKFAAAKKRELGGTLIHVMGHYSVDT